VPSWILESLKTWLILNFIPPVILSTPKHARISCYPSNQTSNFFFALREAWITIRLRKILP